MHRDEIARAIDLLMQGFEKARLTHNSQLMADIDYVMGVEHKLRRWINYKTGCEYWVTFDFYFSAPQIVFTPVCSA